MASVFQYVLVLVFAAGCVHAGTPDAWPPKTAGGNEWIDADTGHKVIRLSRREGANEGFYFHQNPFTRSGDKMVFMGSTDKGRCAFTVDLKTLEIRQITTVNTGFEVVAPECRTLFYISGDSVFSTHLDTLETREITVLPHHYTYGRGLSVNSDETKLAACYCLGEEKYYQSGLPRRAWIRAIWEAKLPNALYTVDIATGKVEEVHRENEWLGHVQFSPTDPTLIAFCHEGPGHDLDRMWTVRSDGSGLAKLYTKQSPRDFQTHEFWSPDGARIWCDFQTPKGLERTLPFLRALTFPKYHLASVDVDTLAVTRYPLKMRHASRHFNISPDQSMFCGDGEGGSFRLCPSRKWIFLYRVRDGKLEVQRLCGMAGHNWKTGPEPNTHFTPDGNWVVFQSDVAGGTQVYAVEVVKHGPSDPQ
jgi:oligogalacturonide lyase